jgi:hypothetical protein
LWFLIEKIKIEDLQKQWEKAHTAEKHHRLNTLSRGDWNEALEAVRIEKEAQLIKLRFELKSKKCHKNCKGLTDLS